MLEVLSYRSNGGLGAEMKIFNMLLIEKAALPIKLDLEACVFTQNYDCKFFGVGRLQITDEQSKSADENELHALKGTI